MGNTTPCEEPTGYGLTREAAIYSLYHYLNEFNSNVTIEGPELFKSKTFKEDSKKMLDLLENRVIPGCKYEGCNINADSKLDPHMFVQWSSISDERWYAFHSSRHTKELHGGYGPTRHHAVFSELANFIFNDVVLPEFTRFFEEIRSLKLHDIDLDKPHIIIVPPRYYGSTVHYQVYVREHNGVFEANLNTIHEEKKIPRICEHHKKEK